MILLPEILDECVEKLTKQGKSKSSAFAICTASLKKAGKLDEEFIESLSEVDEGSFEFDEMMVYAENHAYELWSAPTKRKDLPASHFFDPKNKKYPYRNPDGSVNCAGVMAAWKMAHGARSGKKASPGIVSRIKPYRDKCMKSKSKKQSETLIRRFSFPVSEEMISDSFELADKDKPVNVEILRKGRFKHPWWGILRFDDQFFNTLIRNFNSNIPQEEIAFDFQHRPELGAAAWVTKLFTSNGSLMASVNLTDNGRDAIKKKQFKYFSAEYTDDYVEYHLEDEENEEGVIVEKETKNSFGPCLLGGGLTNRPFIKGMKPVSLSEDGQIIEFEEIEELDDDGFNFNLPEEVDIDMKKKLEDLQKEHDELKAQVVELKGKNDEESLKKLAEVEKNVEEIKEAIKKLQDGGEKTLEDLQHDLEDAKKALEAKETELKELSEKSEQKDEETKKLKEDVKALSDDVTKLMKSNEVLQKEKHKSEMKEELHKFKEMGVFPATIEVLTPILLSEGAENFTVTLSEIPEGKEKPEEKKYTFVGVLNKIFSSIPKEYRFSEDETTTVGEKTVLSVDDVQKYADEKKLSYSDALIALSKEGKIVED